MSDSTLYLYTSLTAGSSHIVTATARVETILKANKLPFRAIDVATDEAARKLWGRRSKGKKLPGLVKYGDIVGDLEQIEEWNEFGELRVVVNSVQDLDGMPATSHPLSATESQRASTPKEPEPAPPKPATIKIQSPPSKTDEKKDDKAILALRQASAEAASKAKNKPDEKQPKPKEEPKEKPNKDQAESQSTEVDPGPAARTHRGSVAPELPDTAPESPKGVKRPPLVPEVAAVSSSNFHADNAEALGLVEHHRGSIISTTDKAEQDKVVHDIRQSISAEEPSGSLEALRQEAAQKGPSETIDEEEPSPSVGAAVTTETEPETKDVPTDATGKEEKPEVEATSAQDPKSAEEATTSVKD